MKSKRALGIEELAREWATEDAESIRQTITHYRSVDVAEIVKQRDELLEAAEKVGSLLDKLMPLGNAQITKAIIELDTAIRRARGEEVS